MLPQLSSNAAVTIKELDNVILTSFNIPPILHHFNMVYHVVGWIKDYIYTPKNHTSPHSFKFEMVSGVESMPYRLWSVDREWVEADPIIDDGLIGASGPAMKIPTFLRSWIWTVLSRRKIMNMLRPPKQPHNRRNGKVSLKT